MARSSAALDSLLATRRCRRCGRRIHMKDLRNGLCPKCWLELQLAKLQAS